MEDKNYILKGVVVKFDRMNRNNGRVYDREVYEKHLEDYQITIKRKTRDRKIDELLGRIPE